VSIEGAIYDHLRKDGPVAATVSSRVYPVASVPQSASLPYISFQKVDAIYERYQGGGSNLAHARFQVDSWTTDQKGASDLGKVVRDALDNYSGTMGEGADATTVEAIFLESERDEFAPPTDASETAVHRVSQDYVIWYRT
jgi:hypothetical protein